MKKQLHIHISEEMLSTIKDQAAKESISVNAYVLSALSDKAMSSAKTNIMSISEDDSPVHLTLSGKVASKLRARALQNGMSARAYVRRLIIFENMDFEVLWFDKATELYDLFKLYKDEIEIISENLNEQLINGDNEEQLIFYLRRILYNQQSVMKSFDRYYYELKKYQVSIKRKFEKTIRDNIYGN